MAARLNPYLTFHGTAREAMTFYQQVLGGDLTISTFGEYGPEGEGSRRRHARPARDAGRVHPHGVRHRPRAGRGIRARRQHRGQPERRRRVAARLLGGPGRGRAPSRCRSRSRCGATSSACSPTGSASRGWSTSGPMSAELAAAQPGLRPPPRARPAPRRCARRGAGGAAAPPGRRRSRCRGAPAYECAVMLSAIECPGIDTG